jgi:hypothetical protein
VHELPAVPEAKEVLQMHDLLRSALQQFVGSVHRQWFDAVDPAQNQKLANNLLLQV